MRVARGAVAVLLAVTLGALAVVLAVPGVLLVASAAWLGGAAASLLPSAVVEFLQDVVQALDEGRRVGLAPGRGAPPPSSPGSVLSHKGEP